MPYIFLDESGDLGFDFSKPRTSRYFVVTFLLTDNKRPIEKAVREALKNLPSKVIKSHSGVLHCNQESPRVRRRLLSELAERDLSIFALCIDKTQTKVSYSSIVSALLKGIAVKRLIVAQEPIALIASRRETSSFLNDNFKHYVKNQAYKNNKLNLQVEIKTPHQEKGLQAVDFISWSIFRKYEYDDETYRSIIRDKIIEETFLKR
jgi:hypothetical protein